jgi:zinc transport system substrate-binding protein
MCLLNRIVFVLSGFFLCQLFAWTKPAIAEPIPIFVSILPQKYFVERIGGDRVQVDVMVEPGKSPAAYNPTPKQLYHLSNAKIFFLIGVPFEKVWMWRIAKNNPDLLIVDSSKNIALIKESSRGNKHSQHSHSVFDPHIWTSPLIVKTIAKNILNMLVEVDPEASDFYMDNYKKFIANLNDLDQKIREALQPIKQRKFMVFHPAWAYFAQTYGLEQIAVEIEGKRPSSRALVKTINQAKLLNIKVVFVQKQFSIKSAETIASALGGKVQAIDHLAENYLENLLLVTDMFSKALK